MNLIQILAIVPFALTAIFSICPYTLAEPSRRTPVILSQAQQNLTGQWELQTGWFYGDGGCLIGSSQPEISIINIAQSGNQFTVNGNGFVYRSRTQYLGLEKGIVSGTKFQGGGEPDLQWLGTISKDGNEITGNITCDKVYLPFTMKRAPNSNPPQSADLCNSGTVTSPTTVTTSHDGSPYQVWTDFRRGKESINPAACGRQYWLKEDPNHYNNGIKFVYLVDRRNVCIVPFLYKENPDGSLESLRAAPECSSAQAIPETEPLW